MPQRFLRPGITNSDRWNKVSFKAQSLFIRLLTIVDDFGRFDGRPAVICAQCFAVWNEMNPGDTITSKEVSTLCEELFEAKLAEFYISDDKQVMQLVQWQERARSEKSKWPDRDSNPLRNPAESCGILPPSPSSLAIVPRPNAIDLTPSVKVPRADALVEIPEALKTPEFEKVWNEWKQHLKEKKVKTTPTAFRKQLEKCLEWGLTESIKNINYSIAKNWQGLFEPSGSTYSNQSGRPKMTVAEINTRILALDSEFGTSENPKRKAEIVAEKNKLVAMLKI